MAITGDLKPTPKSKTLYLANEQDISWIVSLSYEKRLNYSLVQPDFWKMANNSNKIQSKYFKKEIMKKNVIALCHKNNLGFIIGQLIEPPEVYDAGLTLMVDDFCVKSTDSWTTIGKELLEEAISVGKQKGAKQILIVCGNHDKQKQNLLKQMNLNTVSKWYSNII